MYRGKGNWKYEEIGWNGAKPAPCPETQNVHGAVAVCLEPVEPSDQPSAEHKKQIYAVPAEGSKAMGHFRKQRQVLRDVMYQNQAYRRCTNQVDIGIAGGHSVPAYSASTALHTLCARRFARYSVPTG